MEQFFWFYAIFSFLAVSLKGRLKTAYLPIYKNHFKGAEIARRLRNPFIFFSLLFP